MFCARNKKPQGLPMDHKTVFVLDHGPVMAESSKQMIDLDLFFKNRAANPMDTAIAAPPISKTIWSSMIEALCEYCRVVWDIFPQDKLFRFVTSGTEAKILNSWKSDEQNMPFMMKALANVGAPSANKNDEYMMGGMIPGLIEATQLLCEITDEQVKFIKDNPDVKRIHNKGRIIVILHIKNELYKKTLQDTVHNMIIENQRKVANNPDSKILALDQVELVFVHVKSNDCTTSVNEHHRRKISDFLTVEVHDVKSTRHGILISNRLLNLVQNHYDLSATTITGIPMKEEQNSALSQNYDVLLLHRRLPGTPPAEFNWNAADQDLKSTMLLKWRSPKYDPDELYHCTGAARISPVDVNSRPSVCLINFLLNGRCVMLEHWKYEEHQNIDEADPTHETISLTHIISCKGGDIYLHALANNDHNAKLFDATTVASYGAGADLKKNEVRINDFINNIVKPFTLFPLGGTRTMETSDKNLQGAISILEHKTRYWPLLTSKTLVIMFAPTLVDLIAKEELTNEDIMSCQAAIFNLMKRENDKQSLSYPHNTGGRGKRAMRNYNYKDLWEEMEALLRSHADISRQHADILNYFLKSHGKDVVDFEVLKSALKRARSATVDASSISKTSGKPPPLVITSYQTPDSPSSDVINESPESPDPMSPPHKKIKMDSIAGSGVGGKKDENKTNKNTSSLWDIWNMRTQTKHSGHHVEMYGRIADPHKFKLYPNVDDDTQQEATINNPNPQNSATGTTAGGGRNNHNNYNRHHHHYRNMSSSGVASSAHHHHSHHHHHHNKNHRGNHVVSSAQRGSGVPHHQKGIPPSDPMKPSSKMVKERSNSVSAATSRVKNFANKL